ncbi:hypothetical protein THAOC_33590 [Thalassiosira oceanica]|uniref:Uncharacterized protein n=1 Tax=Thalassiosira oceanica TaxID=159749 RepID=K0R6U9_THAOC|nr:hypothetical protein THAOC_33590 [Thalassiosira oceanica]|eukprot:EJK47674.1 hypothetical protein THAOC_33590 [Thalassiosira oceanica]
MVREATVFLLQRQRRTIRPDNRLHASQPLIIKDGAGCHSSSISVSSISSRLPRCRDNCKLHVSGIHISNLHNAGRSLLYRAGNRILGHCATRVSGFCELIMWQIWTETKMKQTGFRVAFFLPPVVVSLGLAVPPLFYELYNFSGLNICQFMPYPMDCAWDDEVPCLRGNTEATVIFFYLFVGFGALSNVTIVVFMVMLTHAIWKQERAMDRFLTPGQEKRRKQTRRTYKQGVRYVVSYLICWMPTFVGTIISLLHGHSTVVLAYLNFIIAPLWGFFLGGVYFVPRYETYREKNPSQGRLQALAHVLNIDIDLPETTASDDTTT